MSATIATAYAERLDDLKVITLTDGEVWSARDLMVFAGYDRWERFSDAITRAVASVNTTGLDASLHFRGTAKSSPMPNGGFRQVEDVELTRYGCYILFQNADARKPEIAAMQSYFAVQTRRQELTVPAALTDDEIVAQALQITSRRVAALEVRVAELEPVAAESMTYRQSAGLRTIQDLANDLRTHALSNLDGVKVMQNDVYDQAGRLGLIIRGDTVRNNQPTAQAIKAGWVKPARKEIEHNDGSTSTKQFARLTPKGGARLWDGCLNYITEHGTLTIQKAVAA